MVASLHDHSGIALSGPESVIRPSTCPARSNLSRGKYIRQMNLFTEDLCIGHSCDLVSRFAQPEACSNEGTMASGLWRCATNGDAIATSEVLAMVVLQGEHRVEAIAEFESRFSHRPRAPSRADRPLHLSRNGRCRKLRRPAVVPRCEGPCGTKNQVGRQADRWLS